MAAFYAVKAASRLYASLSLPSPSMRFAYSSASARGSSQTYSSSRASTSKLPLKKPIPMERTRKSHSSESTISNMVLSRQETLKKPVPLRRPIANSKPKPKPKPKPKVDFAALPYPPRLKSRPPPTPVEYKRHKERMKKNFPEGWAPPRTISREAMEILRALHAEDPVRYRTPVLAHRFKISPEAVSRILKSKWRPSPERIAEGLARDNLNKDKWVAEKNRVERAKVAESLKGRLDIVEKAQGKDRLTMK